jgi:hypothetical protein
MPLALGAGAFIAQVLTYNSQLCCADTAISGSESFMAENKTRPTQASVR